MHDNSNEFWTLTEEYRSDLWRFALGLTRSRESAKDLVSEVVLAAHKSFPNLIERVAFRKFIFTIAVRIHRRQTWRKRIFHDPSPGEDWLVQDFRESQHDLDLLMRALTELPPRQREAILLFEMSGFSLEEVRELQGGSLSGVKTRLARARETLRKRLSDEPIRQRNRKIEIPDSDVVQMILS